MENNDYQKLVIQGTEYTTKLTEKFINRKKWELPNPKLIISNIPGTINTLFVKVGDKVKLGDKLMIVEAMKMMNTIYAPMDGKIDKIYVKIGEAIPKGFVMMEFE